MSEPIANTIVKALRTMENDSPHDLTEAVNFFRGRNGEDPVPAETVFETVVPTDVNAPARRRLFVDLNRWMEAPTLEVDLDGPGTRSNPNSGERRKLIFDALGISGIDDERLHRTFPDLEGNRSTLIVAENWTPWYNPTTQGNFYWDQYRKVLESKGFPQDALADLDESTTKVIQRLSDPSAPEAYQSKGLVMGYVQSGKTANFAGTIAKAVDAGYKLVIVLTGTIELLRAQTQKRLDKELVGVENVLGGVATKVKELERRIAELDGDDASSRAEREHLQTELHGISKGLDYISTGDEDWKQGKFARFGMDPKLAGAPRIIRLTSAGKDFQQVRFQHYLTDYQENFRNPQRPLYDPENLASANALLAVVKKNSSTLSKLRSFLGSMSTDLSEIPALIIDDEADQASINTKRQKKTAEDIERTKINGHIAGILGQMPRCQYLAYTATPFANVFVDPDDASDIFPKDFILALEPSPDYMGAKQYFDLEGIPEDPTPQNSNSAACFRPIGVDENGNAEESDLRAAIDAFILAGAVKLWRRGKVEDAASLRHHTMMIHEGSKNADHAETLQKVQRAWHSAAPSSAAGVARLRKLWEEDFLEVSAARAAESPVPEEFEALKPYIAEAVRRINAGRVVDGEPSPVVLVNGTKDSVYRQPDIDFDGGEVWKILVGGTKLSRGFTVEGLTTTVYTRVTVAADTLMQMGRWFGYRKHYQDLVRLYLGSSIEKGGRIVDLHETFTSIARDEEDFRAELRQFAQWDDTRDPITPMDVAPLVTQRLPWLKPTGANKMYNAKILQKAQGGRLVDLFQMRDWTSGTNARNLDLLSAHIFPALTDEGYFLNDSGMPYRVRYGILPAKEVSSFLDQFKFYEPDSYAAERGFIRSKSQDPSGGGIEDFLIYLPILEPRTGGYAQVDLPGLSGTCAHVLKRQRRAGRNDFSGSSLRQRVAAEIISGRPLDELGVPTDDELATSLRREKRAALMITLAADQKGGRSEPDDLKDPVDPRDIVALLSVSVPYSSAPKGVILRSVRDEKNRFSPIIDPS